MLKMAIGGSVAAVVAISLFAPDEEPLADVKAASPAGFTQIALDYGSSRTKTRKAMSKTIRRCVGVMDEKPLPASVVRKLAEGWGHFATKVDGSRGDVWRAAADSLDDEIEALDATFKRMSSRKRERVVALITTRAPDLARCTVEGYASFAGEEAEAPRRSSAPRPSNPAALRNDASARDDGANRRSGPTSSGSGATQTRLRADGTTDPSSLSDQSRRIPRPQGGPPA